MGLIRAPQVSAYRWDTWGNQLQGIGSWVCLRTENPVWNITRLNQWKKCECWMETGNRAAVRLLDWNTSPSPQQLLPISINNFHFLVNKEVKTTTKPLAHVEIKKKKKMTLFCILRAPKLWALKVLLSESDWNVTKSWWRLKSLQLKAFILLALSSISLQTYLQGHSGQIWEKRSELCSQQLLG